MSHERAAVYLRQSKDSTGAGLAVERQRVDCERLAAERGWTVVATFTGLDKPRPTVSKPPAGSVVATAEELLAAGPCGARHELHADDIQAALAL
jgi:hypothetical protein